MKHGWSDHPVAGHQHGWSTIELLFAVAIISVTLLVVLQQVSLGFRATSTTEQRTFANERAAALLEEIHNAICSGEIENVNDLYALADAVENPVLTTRLDDENLPVEPDHCMSRNTLRQAHWVWARKIEVVPNPQAGLYHVKAHVLRWLGSDWGWEATHSQLMSVAPRPDSPTQTFDVFVLALANVPSMWGDLALIRTQLEAKVAELEQAARVRYRLHWITRLGYGRDACYAPYLNTVATATSAAPFAYWLPGLLDAAAGQVWLYRGETLGGLYLRDGTLVNGYAADSPLPYALADCYNHCLRTPAAERLFEQRHALGLESEDAPPLQILLERMTRTPDRYRGAILLNLHGSMLPMPPLRNYSDAAKDPASWPGVRAVTHPARLHTQRNGAGAQDLELRVHAWLAAPDPATTLAPPITVQIHGVDLAAGINSGAAGTLEIRRLQGGVSKVTGLVLGQYSSYRGFDELPEVRHGCVPPTAPAWDRPYEMYYEAGFVGGAESYTWIRLHNTPVVAPKSSTRGLDPAARLWGCDYCPSPVSASSPFSIDLATHSSSTTQPRNTARWRIRIPNSVFASGRLANVDTVLRVSTRLGTDVTTGSRWPLANAPGNLSETWCWWTDSPNDVPVTERAQFLGDPRCCPYADLMATGTSFPHGYNWHFDDLVDGAIDSRTEWPCFAADRLFDGCGQSRADAPRLLSLLRTAVAASGAVFVNATGETARYLGLGGAIARAAADAGTGSQGVQLAGAFTGASDPVTVNTIECGSPTSADGDQVLVASTSAGTWWHKPWLGELYPDALHAQWTSLGNLTIDDSTGLSWRARHQAVLVGLPRGTSFTSPGSADLAGAGGPLLLKTASLASTMVHGVAAAGATAAPEAGANEIASATNTFTMATLPCRRPFDLEQAFTGSLPCHAFTDTYPATTNTLLENQWLQETWAGAGTIANTSAAGTGFLAPIAFTPAATAMREVCGELLRLAVRSSQLAGLPALPGRVPEVPLLTLLEPVASQVETDPVSLQLRWQVQYLRFDGEPYTPLHPGGFTETEHTLVYRLLTSSDQGVTWRSLLTGQAANLREFPDDLADRVSDVALGNEILVVPMPSEQFPTGEHLFRVEAFDTSRRCHCAAHQAVVLVRRTS
jgi:hypothetical protein